MALFARSKAIKSVGAVTLLAVAGLIALPGLAKAQEETFNAGGFLPVPGLASFDISWTDPAFPAGGSTYFLADRTNKAIDSWTINAANPSAAKFQAFSGGFVGAVLGPTGAVNNDQSGPNGILTFQNSANSGHTEIWIGDGPQLNQGCPSFLAGKCSTTKVIDATTGALTHVIATGGASRADELCYNSAAHQILIANDAEADFPFGTPFITFISTDTYQVVGGMQIPQTTNGIEQCQWDPVSGLYFINIPEVGGHGADTAPGNVLAIQGPSGSTAAKVVATYIIPTADCAGPQGMALGPDPQLLLGCNAAGPGGIRNSLIINRHTGAVIAIGWGVGGADQVWFNPSATSMHYFITGSSCTAASCLNAPNGSQLAIVDGTGPNLDQTIAITPLGGVSSHSVAADSVTNQAFLPIAGGVQIYTQSAPQGTN